MFRETLTSSARPLPHHPSLTSTTTATSTPRGLPSAAMAERDPSPTSVDSVLSHITVQNEEEHVGERSSLSASPPTSTPPTSLGDEASILDDATKMELVAETHEETLPPDAPADVAASPEESTPTAPNSEGRRSSRNARKSVTTYNVQILAGTAIHTPTKYLEKHHKNVLHGPLAKPVLTSPASTPKKRTLRRKSEPTDLTDPAEEQLASEAAQAAQRRTSSRVGDLRKHIFRNLAASAEGPANKAARGKNALASSLRRSASDSRLRQTATSAAAASPRRPRTARAADPDTDEDDEDEEEDDIVKPKTKEWMRQGLYVGQDRDFDARLSESQNRQKRKSRKVKENKVLPLPMFAGERLLNGDPRTNYRDFKLPYDTYHPLPRKIKPDGWVKLHKSKFENCFASPLTNSGQIVSSGMHLLYGNERSKIHLSATVTLKMAAGKLATTASWHTSATPQTADLPQRNAATDLLRNSSAAPRAMATITVLRSWRPMIADLECALCVPSSPTRS